MYISRDEAFLLDGEVMQQSNDGENGKSGHSLEDELILLKAAYALSSVNRRLSLSKLLDTQGNIRVFCRVRPYLQHEAEPERRPLEFLAANEISVSCFGEHCKTFKFDKVFLPCASQDDVFMEVQPIIRCAMDGQNVCIFSYGQTGTGKTYTMEGSKSSPGIIPRALHQLFRETPFETNTHYRYTLSMLEIYKGSLRDLLVPRPSKFTDPPAKSLNIHMGLSEHVEVENLTEYVIENPQDALKLYRKGIRSRTTSTTTSNESSSRSHCLVRISILREDKNRSTTSKLWLIDLGGSERFFKTQAWGKPLDEGKAINVSLTALGDVISALQKKQPHIPYRNSKLTQILMDCLGKNSRVLMFVHPSPREVDYAETMCSLTFASRARGINLSRDNLHQDMVTAKEALLVKKMQAFEGECYRLSCGIQSLESAIKVRRNEDKKVLLLSSNEHESVKVHSSKKSLDLPRFMTPTFSSLCKHRLAPNAEYEPVWPSSSIVIDSKKLAGKVLPSANKKLLLLQHQDSFSSSLSSVDDRNLRRRKPSEGEGDRRSKKQVQNTPSAVKLLKFNDEAREQDSPKSGASSLIRSARRNLNSQKDEHEPVRNIGRIQRRLSLETQH